ncbi:hypothetical protein GCM10027277_35950 [Pseudoduganella ginsengisoli]|uniref:Uncharacterized protein n=1 Tax=Pseudoduganella ginsengisoli TaxID=1462440 RepID=A0A6L6PXD8_9BURK|nr:hypothetical protein [Pseudoduganella ginsengisoli]MTW02217.1 hypothetical protein [Pseudoduganella ginsengisoli]
MAVGQLNQNWIAQRTLLAMDADGREFALTFGVGAPYETGTGECACAVLLDGLERAPHVLFGVDTWQALQLGVQFAIHMLQGFVAQGGQLLWPQEREPMAISELIPAMLPPLAR